ncbi:NAD(P)-binding protein [Lophiostoma macrostomum CBS 122681]|uniref:NAD(P)-binding protein n=1 Tax=Lophiostoma macrostomum CBS 122681 TaxID=1314788 RepID=A0A6A6TD27_9PLEO|nr:NAD(P)-binding protein [Lophiostoma macrostomum CBS 122681]
MESSNIELGSILIIGGAGFLGSYLAQRFHQAGATITIASKRPTSRLDYVKCHTLDLTDEQNVRSVLAEVRPRLILHVATPHHTALPKAFQDCNIKGTSNILRCAAENKDVQALLYTSTIRAISNKTSHLVTEAETVLYDDSSNIDWYSKTKAIADKMVLDANSANLRTASLRVPNLYGGKDNVMNSSMDMLKKGNTEVQLGDNTPLFEFCNIENTVEAHLLAAQALLSNRKGVAGEAFNITDGGPTPWWDFQRKVFAAAGQPADMTKVKTMSFSLLIGAAWIYEWIHWVMVLGRERATFSVVNMKYLRDGNPRLSLEKAKERLGYVPKVDMDEGIKRAVERATSDDLTL